MKNLFYSSATVLAMMLSGCGGGSESEAAACRFSVQQNLDKGNYEAVISELNNPNSVCLAAYNADEWLIDLGSAYMGQAGLSVSDVIGLIGTNDTAGGSTSSFDTFIKGVSEKQGSTALSSLENANSAYTTALDGRSCLSTSITNSDKDICLYIGLAETLRATTTVSYLVEDIAALFDDTNATAQAKAKEEMEASLCALEFINQGSQCSAADLMPTATEVLFTYSDSSTRTFSDIVVTISGNVYHRLGTPFSVTPPSATTIVTSGYCNDDFSGSSATWDATNSPYACPLNQDPAAADDNVTTLLVDTLNGGLDAVEGALSGDVELQQDIADYRNEVDTDFSGDVTITEIQAYLLTI